MDTSIGVLISKVGPSWCYAKAVVSVHIIVAYHVHGLPTSLSAFSLSLFLSLSLSLSLCLSLCLSGLSKGRGSRWST